MLAKVEFSYAYPFVALGFIVMMILGRLIFGDALTFMRVFGTCVLIVGLVIVTYSFSG